MSSLELSIGSSSVGSLGSAMARRRSTHWWFQSLLWKIFKKYVIHCLWIVLLYISVYIPWCQDTWCSTVHGFRICFDHNLHSHCYNDPGRLIIRIGWNHEPVMVAMRHHPQIPLISPKIQLCDSWHLGLAGCNWDGSCDPSGRTGQILAALTAVATFSAVIATLCNGKCICQTAFFGVHVSL